MFASIFKMMLPFENTQGSILVDRGRTSSKSGRHVSPGVVNLVNARELVYLKKIKK